MTRTLKSDTSASIIVFFVALPLCLGIALASGAPLFSGIIAGIVGGIVVGIASGSQLGVSGPAAGLAVIVANAITTLGSWPMFLMAVVLAGCIQLAMGYARAGFIAYFFPTSVIRGMLTGIGLLIILKQIPHALGYSKGIFGEFEFLQSSGENTLSSVLTVMEAFSVGAVWICAISIFVMVLWETKTFKRYSLFQVLQGPVVVVVLGVIVNGIFQKYYPSLYLAGNQLVTIPVAKNFSDFFNYFSLPELSGALSYQVWKVAVIIALVASIETLLCVEATDRLDPHKRVTPVNRELKAQGLGNIISGFLGGLPLTQVIIRSSANISFGAKTKLSTVLHGIFLLLSAITISDLLNLIPIASLATILIVIGYKLAHPSRFIDMYKLGWEQFIPFIATIIGILTTDLLHGVMIGVCFGIFFTLSYSYQNAYYVQKDINKDNGQNIYKLTLAEEVSFFHKASLIDIMNKIPENSKLIIDFTNSKYVDYDVKDFISSYKEHSGRKNILVEVVNYPGSMT